ncbi:hypothetical protein DXG03_008671 [Asterophora parasitica]|uniref:protein-histidine N-methyltransferase n=1 Tax=Asterophora parasitica TaxID=117018 RepID=A0A9P7K7X5_9AGAR|nr:hypothetical protein DXG03_008671 [Asterophora parasitica]
MFKFDFALDDTDVDPKLAEQLHNIQLDAVPPDSQLKQQEEEHQIFREIPLAEILKRLPGVISYSPLVVPILGDAAGGLALNTEESGSGALQIVLARRDLFDARFQLISQDQEEEPSAKSDQSAAGAALQFVQAPSDLVPGVYEGGLKTWECALDLAGYLAGKTVTGGVKLRGKRVLEAGCGTAVPTIYLLRELFSAPPPEANEPSHPGTTTELHIQDYNASVLELVSVPNLILTWYMSPAAASFHAAHPHASPDSEFAAQNSSPDQAEAEEYPVPDPLTPSALPLTPALQAAFLASLEAHHIVLRVFSGSWRTFDFGVAAAPQSGKKEYDVVLTSETIYRSESLRALLGVLRKAPADGDGEHLCLVASKVLYFGVGGGVEEFVTRVKGEGGNVERVWEIRVGVGRRIMRVRW